MKSLYSPKWVTIIGAFLTVIGVSIEPFREDTILLVSIFCAGWLAIILHEFGHIMLGKWSGFEFGFLTAGPLRIEKTMNGIKLKENKSWLFVGGVAMMIPPKTTKEKLRLKWAAAVAGGPAVSLVAATLSYFLYVWFHSDFILFLVAMNGAIFMATIIPMKTSMRTDGYQLITLFQKNEKTSNLIDDLQIMRELLSKKHPLDWSHEYVEKAREKEAKAENVFYAQMIFYKEVESSGFEVALKKIKSYRNIAYTKKSKHTLGFLIHLEQLSNFFCKEPDLEEITHLQRLLSKIEPISYYRGKALIEYLRHNEQEAFEHLQYVKREIAENETLYGFLKAEKTLTKLVEDKIAI